MESDSDEDIWNYTSETQKIKSSRSLYQKSPKRPHSGSTTQSQPFTTAKGKGKGKGKSSSKMANTQPSQRPEKTVIQTRNVVPESDPAAESKTVNRKRKTPLKPGVPHKKRRDETTEDKLKKDFTKPEMPVSNKKTKTAGGSTGKSKGRKTQTPNTKSGPHKRTPAQSQRKEEHCPHCQMPFICVVVQSPSSHTRECMDTPIISTTECAQGLTCSSTLPSHYRKYIHTALANLRAGPGAGRETPGSAKKTPISSGISTKTPTPKAHRKLDFNSSQRSTVNAPKSPYFKNTNSQPLFSQVTPRQSLHLAPLKIKNYTVAKVADVELFDDDDDIQIPVGVEPLEMSDKRKEVSHEVDNIEEAGSDEDIFIVRPKQETSVSEDGLTVKEEKEQNSEDFCQCTETNDHDIKSDVVKGEDALETDNQHAKKKLTETHGQHSISHEDVPVTQKVPKQGLKEAQQEASAENTNSTSAEEQHTDREESVPVITAVFSIKERDLNDMLADAFEGDDDTQIVENDTDISPPTKETRGNVDYDDNSHQGAAHSDGEEDEALIAALNEPFIIEPEDSTLNTDCAIVSTVPATPSPTKTDPSVTPSPSGNILSRFFGGISAIAEKVISTKAATKQTSIASFFGGKTEPKTELATKINAVGMAQDLTSLKVAAPPRTNWSLLRSGSNPVSSVANNTTGVRRQWGNGAKRQCPFYKKMPGTSFTVDAFQYGSIPGCTAYFLTHFHYDHYGGLKKNFSHPIYCSKVTGNLVMSKIKVNARYIHAIPLDTPRMVDGVEVTFMEANHCPGAVIILFKLKNGQTYLHTGDFRACIEMERYPFLQSVHVNQLYLDTTYCDPSYAFPSQREVIRFTVNKVSETLHEYPNTVIAVGSYTIGKERIFTAIAESLNSRICVSREKKVVLECLEDAQLKKRLTLDPREARVHVLPMRQLKYQSLHNYVQGFKPRFDRILAIEPTGWTHSSGTQHTQLYDLRPKLKRDIVTIYGVPYSEHSSYTEMKRFCQFLQADKILATVNNGNAESRTKMEKIFESWRKEKIDSPCKSMKQSDIQNWFAAK